MRRGALAQAEPQQQMLTRLFWPGRPLSFSVSNRFPSQSAGPKAQGLGSRRSRSRGSRSGGVTQRVSLLGQPRPCAAGGGCSLRPSPQMRDPSAPAPPVTLGGS